MRRGLIITTLLLSSAIALSGCMEKIGDLGNKNIRPNSVRKQEIAGNGILKMRFADDQANEQNRKYGKGRVNNNVVGMHGNSRIELSNKIGDKIAAIPSVHSAYVMMTNKNAYVAVKLDHAKMQSANVDLTNSLKDKIANQVKILSPSVENIYVSANPDFIGRMEGYAAEVKQGRSIQGLLAEFNALVERIFPAESGIKTR